MPKTIDQIESDLDYSRNALARRKLTSDESQDPASLLLWQQALDNADILLATVRALSESGALQAQAFQNVAEVLQEAQRGREALEADNTRLTQENERLHQLFHEVSPRDYFMFRQASVQDRQ